MLKPILGRFRGLSLASLLFAGLAPGATLWAAVDGKAVYEKNCSVCHGDQGDGATRARAGLNPPPRDFTTPVAQAELSRARMVSSVREGRSGTAMMAFGQRLSEAEIAAVVDYIRATFMQKPAHDSMITTPQMELGRNLYIRNCAVCHGDNGNGAMWTSTSLNPPPRDFTRPQARAELSRERMLTSVTYGRPGTAMMSFAQRLTDGEIQAVVDYVRASFMSSEPAAVPPSAHTQKVKQPPDMRAPFARGLQGRYALGRDFYQNNCFSCHGELGDGLGPRAKFIQPPPRNFLSAEARSRLNRPALFQAISSGVPGTVMPAWGKVLSDQEIADVGEYVYQAFIQGRGDKKKH